MLKQLKFFLVDVKRMLGKYKSRLLYIWLSRSFWGILIYRIERGAYISIGSYYEKLRILFIPFINLIQAYSNIDIHYKAEIGAGLAIFHPSVGIVISGYSIIGSNLSLTGGNIIGAREGCSPGSIKMGNNCSLGANAVVLGPIIIGNNVKIGASACVVRDCLLDEVTLIGVPAKALI
ncbi:hypothetical protein [Sphingobacterium siyangense]|uniref:serine O-acetyltransferase n=1 Tax=Sphingobacterium siyangense TaxID=459529 RepID=UPI002FDD7FD6